MPVVGTGKPAEVRNSSEPKMPFEKSRWRSQRPRIVGASKRPTSERVRRDAERQRVAAAGSGPRR